MSKMITLGDNDKAKLLEEIAKKLGTYKMSDGTFKFSADLGKLDRQATVVFSPLAYCKMMMLVSSFSTEVAWQGVARRSDEDDEDIYFIDDVVCYPQEVAAATTKPTDDYDDWAFNLDESYYNNLRMQGHSHVNMGTSPSGPDHAQQEEYLSQLTAEDFYIFLIWNKRNEHYAKIFDIKKNVMFDDKDINVIVADDSGFISDEFIAEAKDMVSVASPISYAKPAAKPAKATKKKSDKTVPAMSAASVDDEYDDDFPVGVGIYPHSYSDYFGGRWSGNGEDPYSAFGYLD